MTRLEKCPVCWRRIAVTWPGRLVSRHEDKAGAGCPMTGKAYPLGLYEEVS